jgi:hypothetical protein
MRNLSRVKKQRSGVSRAPQQKEAYRFFHPDYTVAAGVSPAQPEGSRSFTAGGESHPALKQITQLV